MIDLGQRGQRQQQGRPGLGQQPGDQRDRGLRRAAAARPRWRTLAAAGDAQSAALPVRRTAAAAPAHARTARPARRPAPAPRRQLPVRSRDQPTAPAAEWMRGASLTATTAANPTPNRPTVPAGAVGRWLGVPLARRPQRGQRLDPGRVQRRPGVGGGQRPVAQRQPQPPGHPGPGGRVGRVLRQLHHDPVPVAAERVVLLGVGVLTEPRGRRRPGVEHPAAQRGGGKGIVQPVRHSPTLWHQLPAGGR